MSYVHKVMAHPRTGKIMKTLILWSMLVGLMFIPISTSTCSQDDDCFLNGVCINSTCFCDPGWIGNTCNILNLTTAPIVTGYGMVPNVTAWGGIPVLVGNTYHLLNTEIINGCGLCKWGTNSRVIHATSNTLLGPYKFQNEALGVWSHNPHIVVDTSSGTPIYLLFHIGTADGGVTPAVCNASSKQSTQRAKRDLIASSGILHTATDPAGPWTPQNPPGLGLCNNPSPYIYPNGNILLVCTPGGTDVWTAPSWKGPWKSGSLKFTGDPGVGTWEDPFIWRDQRGNFKMVAHVYPSQQEMKHFWDRVSGFAYSKDGLTWVRQPWQPYTNEVQHTNSTIGYTTRERPKIFFDKQGTPLALFTGVAEGTNCWDCKGVCGVDWTYNLAQPIGT